MEKFIFTITFIIVLLPVLFISGRLVFLTYEKFENFWVGYLTRTGDFLPNYKTNYTLLRVGNFFGFLLVSFLFVLGTIFIGALWQ